MGIKKMIFLLFALLHSFVLASSTFVKEGDGFFLGFKNYDGDYIHILDIKPHSDQEYEIRAGIDRPINTKNFDFNKPSYLSSKEFTRFKYTDSFILPNYHSSIAFRSVSGSVVIYLSSSHYSSSGPRRSKQAYLMQGNLNDLNIRKIYALNRELENPTTNKIYVSNIAKDLCVFIYEDKANVLNIVSSKSEISQKTLKSKFNNFKFYLLNTGCKNDKIISLIEGDSSRELRSSSLNFWNYLISLLALNSEDSEKILELKEDLTKEKLVQNDIKISSEYPKILQNIELIKIFALKEFNSNYKSDGIVKKNPEFANIAEPKTLICKILKLKENVESFALAGTEIIQVEIFDDTNSLICVAWINPDNNTAEATEKDNAVNSQKSAKSANAKQVIFILEPAQALLKKSE